MAQVAKFPAPQANAIPERLVELIQAPNIADILSDDDLGVIASEALDEYDIDKQSMKDWLKRMKLGIELAEMTKETKEYPWENAANIKYPLVTTAALQFNAKAYPAIVPNADIVKVKVFGADPQGKKAARGERVSAHMSYDLICGIPEWEEETDKLLVVLPTVGHCIRKVWHDPAKGRKRVRLIESGKVIINDHVRNIEDAPRITEEIAKYPSEIAEHKLSGWYRNVDYLGGDDQDKDAPQDFIEQHRLLDLDKDGYPEPYVVTVHKEGQKVARIVADFEEENVKVVGGKVVAIERSSYFVSFQMLPSLTGGFWGVGFGLLLGDISETINSICNQMLDAGHMASRGGGFIGSEFRIKGGSQQFKPGEWRMTTAMGSSIKDALVPLTFPGPDKTLFEMLGLLIEAGKEVASIKDILMGESGGKTMTATTTMALIEQGMAQFTAAYKRIFRALRAEFKLIAKINAKTTSAEEYNRFHDEMEPVMGPEGPMMGPDGQPQMQPLMYDPAVEYDMSDMDIIPVADPASVTSMQRIAKAQMLGEMAEKGMVNPQVATQRMLEAASIEDAEELIPQPDPMAQAMGEAQLQLIQGQAAEAQAKAQEAMGSGQVAGAEAMLKQAELQLKEIELQLKAGEGQAKMREADEKAREIDAKIALTMAQIQKIHAEIEQKQREIELQAQQVAITEAKTGADIERSAAEVDLQRHAATREDRKADADIGFRDQELGLKRRDGDVAAHKTAADIEHQKRALDTGDKSTDADIELKRAQAKTTLKPAKDPNKADPEAEAPKKAGKRKIRVTKHDDKGRILEIEESSE